MAFGDLNSSIKVQGWKFKLSKDDNGNMSYDCRGDVHYDDYGDEQVEPSLERAAFKLRDNLIAQGYEADIAWSEKGWIGVNVK
jgi:hypothetical protein